MNLTTIEVALFQKEINNFYEGNRRDLPWRRTEDPYAILVSEIMLQQTQVSRVIEKYKAWIRRFPTQFELAQADMVTILPYWTGLGYNRRALFLKQCADEIVNHYHGIFPTSHKALIKLPGIGDYTAKAVCVYAYNQPLTLIETNIRTIYIHHFFKDTDMVEDSEIIPLVEQTLDRDNPRRWFSALMDYGTVLKQNHPNPSRKSKSYTKQKPLKGSVREVRGWIVKQLTHNHTLLITKIVAHFKDSKRVENAIEGLIRDEIISRDKDSLSIK